jgi:Iron-containing redox enzyme
MRSVPDLREDFPHVTAALGDAALRSFAGRNIYAESDTLIHPDNPFRRPLLNDAFDGWDRDQYSLDDLACNGSLIANRVLLAVYEQDFVFLPRGSFDASKRAAFVEFYQRDARVAGEILSCRLEKLLFSCVSNAVHVSGDWHLAAFEAYFEDFKNTLRAEKFSALMDSIAAMRNPVAGARTFLVQMAGDFLVESSAMARNVVGNYGPVQSELFKVLIDECGYGVFKTKHSTLFEDVLESLGLDPIPHAYWQLYLPTSMYLNNYYNCICRDHASVFRYFGAILQVETAFRLTCDIMARMMKAVFGPSAPIEYFREHTHIDDHHSRMVMDRIVAPIVRSHGEFALREIVRGFEESLVVGDQFTAGLQRQIDWMDRLDRGDGVRSLPGAAHPRPMRAARGELRGTRMADADTGYEVVSGALNVVFGLDHCLTLEPGERITIPRHVLYGVSAAADCEYRVHLPEETVP